MGAQVQTSDPEDRPRRRLISVIAVALLGGGAIYAVATIVSLVLGVGTPLDGVGAVAMFLAGLAIFLLHRSSRLRAAGIVVSVLLVAVPIFFVLVEGYKTTSLLLLAGAVVFADLLVGGKSGLITAGAATALYLVTGYVNSKGLFHVPYESPFFSDAILVAIVLVGMALAGGSFIQELRRVLRERDERQAALQAASAAQEQLVAELQGREQAQRRLLETVRELGSPVIPLARGVIAIPLIGTIDSERAQSITANLLQGVAEYHARTVIVDITGVPLVDTAVAGTLLRAAQGVRLLGAEPILTGIRSEVAQTIVGLGVDLSGIVTRSTIEEGLAHALQAEVES